MKLKLASPAWSGLTGNFGAIAFVDGVSVEDLSPHIAARIASSVKCVDAETGEDVGPAALTIALQNVEVPVLESAQKYDDVLVSENEEKERLAAENKARKEADDAAYAAALEKAKVEAEAETEEDEDLAIYSRLELEAIGANEGINRLREIANPLGVKAPSITKLVEEILSAQQEKVLV